MKGVIPWLVRWACSAGEGNIYTAFAAPVGPVKNFLPLTEHLFNYFVLIAHQAGQAAALGRLSLSMCHWRSPDS
jgi:hypothetical protein